MSFREWGGSNRKASLELEQQIKDVYFAEEAKDYGVVGVDAFEHFDIQSTCNADKSICHKAEDKDSEDSQSNAEDDTQYLVQFTQEGSVQKLCEQVCCQAKQNLDDKIQYDKCDNHVCQLGKVGKAKQIGNRLCKEQRNQKGNNSRSGNDSRLQKSSLPTEKSTKNKKYENY